MYSKFSLGLSGAQVTGVLSSIILAQTVDDQCHGLPKVEHLMFVTACQDYAILLPYGCHYLFGSFTLQTDLPLLLSYCILQ